MQASVEDIDEVRTSGLHWSAQAKTLEAAQH